MELKYIIIMKEKKRNGETLIFSLHVGKTWKSITETGGKKV